MNNADLTTAAPNPNIPHGKRSSYIHHKCRCPDCTAANTSYKRSKYRHDEIHAAQRAERRALTRLKNRFPADFLRYLGEERQREGLA